MAAKDFRPEHITNLNTLRKKTITKIAPLTTYVATSGEPVAIEKRDSLSYKRIKPGYPWAKKVYDCGWFHFEGEIPDEIPGCHLMLNINIGGEGLAYSNDNKPYEMISIKSSPIEQFSLERGKSMIAISDAIIKNGKIDFYMDAGYNATIGVTPIGIGLFGNADIVAINDDYYDYFYDYLAVVSLYIAMPDSDKIAIGFALDESYKAAMGGDIKNARATLSKYINSEPLDFKLYAVGHSHLDLAWLWPIRETKRKSVRTFTRQMNNIEKFDDYIYGASQPWQFEYLKNNQPAVYERIKNYVELGRIEPQGGMYVEADTNISGGEALIRQFWYGKKFFKDEFGKDMEICWLPDVFGYNGNLPQIMKKCQIPYFFTIKLSWNEHNKFPNRSFNWSGIDGSEVLVHMAPDETYNSNCSPAKTQHAYENYPEKDVSREALYVYGVGDGGGGPSNVHLEFLNRQHSMYKTPVVEKSSAIDYFKILEGYKEKLPSYSGELYLEKHQGTYTTQGRNKRYNRLCEYALEDIETLSSIAYLKGREYNSAKIDEWWKEILLYQFHDIIPGSSIGRVYDESTARYAQILKEIEAEKKEILTFLSGEGDTVLAFNPTSFERDEITGGKACNVSAFASAPLKSVSGDIKLSAGGDTLANKYLTVKFNRSGEIISLKDAEGKEYSKEYLNRLKLFYDKPLFFNAWDIDWKYHDKKGLTLKAYKSETLADKTEVKRINYYRHGLSHITQEISLGINDDFVKIKTNADFHETFQMLRAEFVPTVFAPEVSCDIQYGTIKRTTKDQTLLEKAQFEICAHKYIDVSDDECGFSLLNDCKYGHRVKEGLISLNLLRSPKIPDPKADMGKHEFTYAIYPHKNGLSLDTLKRAYSLNKPLYTYKGEQAIEPIISVDNENIVIELVKKAYNDNALIVRMYESQGIEESTKLDILFDHGTVTETDMLEKGGKRASLKALKFTPYEIKTIKIKLKETEDK